MIDTSEIKSLGNFDDAAAKAKEEAEQGKPKPIHFRPTRHDQWLIDQLREDVSGSTSAGVIRHALEMAVAHRLFVQLMLGKGPLWQGDPEAKGMFEGLTSMVEGDYNEQ